MKIIGEASMDVISNELPLSALASPAPRRSERSCDLCGEDFPSHAPLERFCEPCKTEKELYQLAEWFSVW